jgi:putative DNA-invertase from lambdoid prophage Rac
VKEVGSGASQRQLWEKLLDAARRREIDVVLMWRLDRWGRSVADLLATLQELDHLGVGFVSLTEALDLTTPAGRAMAALLAVFAEFEREILRERVRAGLAHARQNGKRLGRPITAATKAGEVRALYRAGISKAEIARRLQIVGRPLAHAKLWARLDLRLLVPVVLHQALRKHLDGVDLFGGGFHGDAADVVLDIADLLFALGRHCGGVLVGSCWHGFGLILSHL